MRRFPTVSVNVPDGNALLRWNSTQKGEFRKQHIKRKHEDFIIEVIYYEV